MNCKNCPHSSFGSFDGLSDICDSCRNDPNVGWGGFFDHSIDISFSNNQEQINFIVTFGIEYEDEHNELQEGKIKMEKWQLTNVNFEDLMTVIDKCTGAVWLVTPDQDRINLKSKLSQILGIREIFKAGTIEAIDIQCSNPEDNSRIFRFLLYREI